MSRLPFSPPLEPDHCLRLYRKLTGGVSVVSVAGDDGPHGMTASTVTSVSLRPPLLFVCLDSRSTTLSLVRARGAFGVQLLRADQRDVARTFAAPGAPRLERPAFQEVLGVPVLTDCLAWSVCVLTDCRAYGDHHAVIGRLVATGDTSGRPLVWHDQEFADLGGPAPHRATAPRPVTAPAPA